MLGGAHAQKVEVWGRVNGAFGEREVVRNVLFATLQNEMEKPNRKENRRWILNGVSFESDDDCVPVICPGNPSCSK